MLQIDIYAAKETASDVCYDICNSLVGTRGFAENDIIVPDPDEEGIIHMVIGEPGPHDMTLIVR